MKKIGLIILVLMISGIFILSVVSVSDDMDSDSSGNSKDAPNFVVLADLPENGPTSLNSYILAPEDYDEETYIDIADEMDLNSEVFYYEERNAYVIVENECALQFFEETGVWMYADTNRMYDVSEEDSQTIPDDNQAQSTAETFLQNNIFWTDDMTLDQIFENKMGEVYKGTEEIIDEWTTSKKVCFYHFLDDLSIEGVGAKCSVTIGVNSSIVGFTLPVRDYIFDEEVDIISYNDAFENLENGVGLKRRDRIDYNNRTLVIEDVRLCYYVDDLYAEGTTIEPCYAFEGYYEGTDYGFIYYIEAIEE